ncbi:macrolide ABC transporter ATP-binding protein [candidate division WWE3 bacterium CG_4_9_14_0_2_um_filter_35_11]|uniref:Macrolide ABC transporter ATP-binding protein n=1 Tax=candidate division WWE3 bacterium CG_4_9_14_0_2_um_filter_35_11 TaxID=1975077 RepID=A0A2M8EL68_UNCKA|nr:MAG: macrolide ABC transporter ATP-binding protein [candidate division WWE3 bacterium CG10_big_fil_rev_8_21_14_0_10_35_32]PJC23478.1 MAG: macrolide ABC transporter ATP-binding protein [candidate division WWE3 bacterium CG_4_9_14_0_2_um_filter_35_11]
MEKSQINKVSQQTLIETQNIYKTYKLGTEIINALSGVDIKIKKGEFVSIVGKSGSGKSTLMHLIGLLDTPTSGKILLNDKDVSRLNQNELAFLRNKSIGFVFQSFNLLQRTSTIDNVILPLKYSKTPKSEWAQKALKMLELVGLSERKNNKPNELSGGQKQRIAIARALVNDPDLILADEPTGNLDSKTGAEIIELFRKLNKSGKTVVIVTHDEELANVTNRKIIIKDGKVSKSL